MENKFFIKNIVYRTAKCIGKTGDFLYWTPNYSESSQSKKLTVFKTDINLNLIWRYEFTGEGYFFNLVQSSSNPDHIILLGDIKEAGDTNSKLLLTKLDELGSVVWFKKYDVLVNSQNTFINQLPSSGYVINSIGKLFTIDESGTIVASKLIENDSSIELIINDVEVVGSSIYVVCASVVAILLQLDTGLNFVSGFRYTRSGTTSGTGRQFIKSFNNKLFVSYTVANTDRVIFSIDISNNLDVVDSIVFGDHPKSSKATNEIFVSSTGNVVFYYSPPSNPNRNTFIYRLDESLNLQWVKKTEDLEIWDRNFKAFDGFYIFSTLYNGTNIWSDKSIIKTDTSLTSSCVGVVLESISPSATTLNKQSYTAVVQSNNISVSNPNYQQTDLGLFEIITICPRNINQQSNKLYLQSAGSTGTDGSTEGIHLRWLLKKDLIKHLPKGNLALTTANYNKANDFVKIYRAPYAASETTFDLTQTPKVVDNRNAVWLYEVNGIKVYLYFKNKGQYDTVKNTTDPLTQPTQFLAAYGAELLELESKNELFFSVEFNVSAGTSPIAETELLSVEENTLTAEKAVTARKTFTGTSELSNTRMVTENGRSFRFRLTNCEITSISVEFYGTLAANIESGTGWTDLGDFSLSTTDSEVFSRLEPSTDLVNGQWQRYNDNAYVNIQNYKDKWNVTNPNTQSSIKETVQDYITLSDDVDNPSAVESFTFSDVLPDGVTNPEDDSFEIANLTLLQQASLDYHVARMLGLGHLDVDNAVQNNDAFVYMAVYETKVTLQDGQYVTEDTEHRYITVPTSKSDERLPNPVDLREPVLGIYPNNGINEEALPLTDDEGYTQDGKARFVSLFVDEPEDLSVDRGFYNSTTEFNLTETTSPVFAGIEYKGVGEANWRKPELPNSDDYQNEVPNGESPHNETLPLPIPDEGMSLYVHRERETGEHVYGSYGINWFSRASQSSVQWNLLTTIQPKDTLVPPHNRNALLIREESPLLLTSSNEQQLLDNIPGTDKTLVRLVFDYNTKEELMTYKVTPESMAGATDPLDSNSIFPDSQEIFADEVEIYFRSELPLNITGKALNVQDHPSNEVLSIIATGVYVLDSTGETIMPVIPTSQLSNFVGGVLVLEENEFIIHEVTEAVEGPVFTVYKKQLSDRLQTGTEPSANEELEPPIIRVDGMFIAVENLQNVSSWGSPNPHPLKVQLGDNWGVHRELITREGPNDGLEQAVEKSRGIWDTALIEEVPQTVGFDVNEQPILEHRGLYKATFSSTQLSNHPQSSGGNPVQWYKGIVRVHTLGDPDGERKALDVVKMENIGTSNNLIVYFVDGSFSTDPAYDSIQIGNIEINYYPGYRIYLYADIAAGLSGGATLPNEGEGIRYTCFGFRSVGNSGNYASRISVPTVMFAQEVVTPLPPELPVGPTYATRPDGFGKSTYTLTTQFSRRPHGIQYYRIDDNTILNALYSPATVETVKQDIGQSDMTFLSNRWQNLLGFDYDYPPGSYQTDGLFAIYPEDGEGYRLPNPDNESLFDVGGGEVPGNIDPGAMVDRIQSAIYSVFTPLTEIPVLFEYINGSSYRPIPKKQVVRDENGALLAPGSPEFDMAPMAKIVATNQVQFTDFTLDGTSNNLYFYAVKELGNQMQISDFSPILGPIKLVNTNPPQGPSIKKAVPVLEDTVLGIPPQIRVEVNAFPKVEGIKKLALYRSLEPSDALSVRSMELVKELDLEVSGQILDDVWEISDDFSDLVEVPYADPIYYRVVALREIEHPDKGDTNIIVTDYVASQPSKLLVTAIVENAVPLAPQLSYTANTGVGILDSVVLQWNKTAYNAKYFLFKMTNEGQWTKIFETVSNDETISVPLLQTDLATDTLSIEDSDGNNVYHHFKVSVENTSNLLSQEDEVLTIPLAN